MLLRRELYQISLKFNDLVERIRPESVSNIQDAQEKQKQNQDKRNKPTEIILEKRTPVMIKVEGLK